MTEATSLEPIFVSVREAARIIGISPWSVYQLLDSNLIESRYQGRRRLVDYTSLRTYAKNLPTKDQTA